jgi:hypothetical protein
MRPQTTFTLIFALLLGMQSCAGNHLLVDFGTKTDESPNYKDCTDNTKEHATNMFHDHVWPKINKEGSRYEVTNCLEKSKAHRTGHSDYEIIVQMGDKTCSFKLKYDSSKPVDQRVLLNDIEEEIKVCSGLNNASENTTPVEEPAVFVKPIMDAYYHEEAPMTIEKTEEVMVLPPREAYYHEEAPITMEKTEEVMVLPPREAYYHEEAPMTMEKTEEVMVLPPREAYYHEEAPITMEKTEEVMVLPPREAYYHEEAPMTMEKTEEVMVLPPREAYYHEEAPMTMEKTEEVMVLPPREAYYHEEAPMTMEKTEEVTYVTKPLIEAANEEKPLPVQESTEEVKYLTLPAIEPVTEHHSYPTIETFEDITYETNQLVEPVRYYKPYPEEVLDNNTEWKDCTNEQVRQVGETFNSLALGDFIHPTIVYSQNIKNCKVAPNESRFKYIMSFNFKVCTFHVRFTKSEATLLNVDRLRGDDCRFHLKETPREIDHLFE